MPARAGGAAGAAVASERFSRARRGQRTGAEPAAGSRRLVEPARLASDPASDGIGRGDAGAGRLGIGTAAAPLGPQRTSPHPSEEPHVLPSLSELRSGCRRHGSVLHLKRLSCLRSCRQAVPVPLVAAVPALRPKRGRRARVRSARGGARDLVSRNGRRGRPPAAAGSLLTRIAVRGVPVSGRTAGCPGPRGSDTAGRAPRGRGTRGGAPAGHRTGYVSATRSSSPNRGSSRGMAPATACLGAWRTPKRVD